MMMDNQFKIKEAIKENLRFENLGFLPNWFSRRETYQRLKREIFYLIFQILLASLKSYVELQVIN